MKWCTNAACQRSVSAICIKTLVVNLETATAFGLEVGLVRIWGDEYLMGPLVQGFQGWVVDFRIKAGDTSLGFASCSRYCISVCFLDFGSLTCLLNMLASTGGVRQAIDSCGPEFDDICYHRGRELSENWHRVAEVASNCRLRYRPGRLTAAGVG